MEHLFISDVDDLKKIGWLFFKCNMKVYIFCNMSKIYIAINNKIEYKYANK